jgi:AcrR family transcriptional regulator
MRADAARNRERVLRAAAEVFAERGLDATLDDVARRACVGVGTVYRRFPNKEALIEALFTERVDEVVALALEAGRRPDAWEGFVLFLERSLELQSADRGLRDAILRSDYGRDRVAGGRVRIVAVVGEVMRRAQRAGQLRPDVTSNDLPMIMRMIDAVSETAREADPDLWRRYLALVIDGLRADRSDPSDLGPPPSEETADRVLTRR